MKNVLGRVICVVVFMVILGEACRAEEIRHRFACADYTAGKVFIVDETGKVEWQYDDAEHCNDLWVLPNGNLLFSRGHGVREITRDKEVVFDYESKSEIYACQRLANGNTFIGECNNGRLLEISPAGKIVKEVRLLAEGEDGGHGYMRNARKLCNGHYLVTHNAMEVVIEYDGKGAEVKRFEAPGGPHSVVRLDNGNTLIACGDRRKEAMVFEVDAAGKVVWKIEHDELPGISLKFMTGLHRLANGNTVMSNWLGHRAFGQAPHIIEVTRDKRVVWRFEDHQTMRTVSSVQVLEVGEDATRGEVKH